VLEGMGAPDAPVGECAESVILSLSLPTGLVQRLVQRHVEVHQQQRKLLEGELRQGRRDPRGRGEGHGGSGHATALLLAPWHGAGVQALESGGAFSCGKRHRGSGYASTLQLAPWHGAGASALGF